MTLYDEAAPALDQLNALMADLGAVAAITHHNGLADLVTIAADGTRTEVATRLTARQLIATIRMVERVTRHAVGLASG